MPGTAGKAGTRSEIMFSYGLPHMAELKQGDQLEPTYSSSLRIRDIALRTGQKRWTIGRSGERGLGISLLVARHDDDDDEGWYCRHRDCDELHWDLRFQAHMIHSESNISVCMACGSPSEIHSFRPTWYYCLKVEYLQPERNFFNQLG